MNRHFKRLPWSNTSIIETISALLVFLFMYTAFSKLNEQANFIEVLGKSPLLGPYKSLLAWSIPMTEIILSMLLIFPKTRGLGLKGSLALMTLFTLYLIYMVIFTPKLPCSCGGVISKMSWTQHIFFNILFIALSIIGIYLNSKRKDKDNLSIRIPPQETPTQLSNS